MGLRKVSMIVLCMVVLAGLVYSASTDGGSSFSQVGLCPSNPFCGDNSANITQSQFLTDGEKMTVNYTLRSSNKGAALFRFITNSTSNATTVASTFRNITIFEKSPVVPLFSQLLPGDIFTVNQSQYNSTFLTDGEKIRVSWGVVIPADAPTPTNWSFRVLANSSANTTKVFSDSINIEIISTPPDVSIGTTIVSPSNVTFVNQTILIDVDSVGSTLDTCWYRLNNGANVTYTCNQSFTLNFVDNESGDLLDVFLNSTNGSIVSDSVSFTMNRFTSLGAVKFNIPDFSFASSTPVTGIFENFNSSGGETNFTLFYSMNVKKSSVSGSDNNVFVRLLVDGALQTEELVRSLSGINISGSTGLRFVKFNTSSGQHNFSLDFFRSGQGTVDVVNNDVVLVRFKDTDNLRDIHEKITEVIYSFSSTEFTSAFNWTLEKNNLSGTFIAGKFGITSTGESTPTFFYDDDSLTDPSPIWQRHMASSLVTGTASGIFLDEEKSMTHNHTIRSRTDANTVTVNGTIINFDLGTMEGSIINGFEASNQFTNLTENITLLAGQHNLVNTTIDIKDSDSLFMGFQATFISNSSTQTPLFFINISGTNESVCAQKERTVGNTERGANVFIYTVCHNLTRTKNYTVNVWVNVPTGQEVIILDESLAGVESEPFDTSTSNLAPLPGEFFEPINNSNLTGSGLVRWGNASDLDGDLVNYTIFTYNADSTLNSTLAINVSNNSVSIDYSSFLEGFLTISQQVCDTFSACNPSNTKVFIDNTIPSVNVTSPANISYAPSGNIAINVTTNDFTVCFHSNGSANITILGNGTVHSDYYTPVQGNQYLTISCNNSVGLGNSTNVTFFVDSIFPVWVTKSNTTDPDSGGIYNPLQSYVFSINFTDNIELSNITLSFNGTNTTTSVSGTTGNVTINITTLGAFNWTYYWFASDTVGNTNYSDLLTFEVRTSNTSTQTYINSSRANFNILFGNSINFTVNSSNTTSQLYINNTLFLNPSIVNLSSGTYNVTGITLGNNNYSASSERWNLTVSKQNTTIKLHINGELLNGMIFNLNVNTVAEFNVSLFDNYSNPLALSVDFYHNLSGTWTLNTSAISILNKSINMTYAANTLYEIGGRFVGNDNYSIGVLNNTIRITDFNVSWTFACGEGNLTYFKNGTVFNETITLVRVAGNKTSKADIKNIVLNFITMYNASSNDSVFAGNYTTINATFFATNFSTFQNQTVNVTYDYYAYFLHNNTQQRAEPFNQSTDCGIFNVTLNSVGSTTDAKIFVSLANTISNTTIKVGNDSSYNNATGLVGNGTLYQVWANLTLGASKLFWHFLSMNGTAPGTSLSHVINFFAEGT